MILARCLNSLFSPPLIRSEVAPDELLRNADRTMSVTTLLPLLLVFLAGGMVALQAPTNVMLAKAGGSPVLAALISFAVGTAALLTVWLATAKRTADVSTEGLPWYAWLRGVYGAFFDAVAAYASPRFGLVLLITIGIAGQIPMALWLDHIGALGLPSETISFPRVAGALLVVVGVALVWRG